MKRIGGGTVFCIRLVAALVMVGTEALAEVPAAGSALKPWTVAASRGKIGAVTLSADGSLLALVHEFTADGAKSKSVFVRIYRVGEQEPIGAIDLCKDRMKKEPYGSEKSCSASVDQLVFLSAEAVFVSVADSRGQVLPRHTWEVYDLGGKRLSRSNSRGWLCADEAGATEFSLTFPGDGSYDSDKPFAVSVAELSVPSLKRGKPWQLKARVDKPSYANVLTAPPEFSGAQLLGWRNCFRRAYLVSGGKYDAATDRTSPKTLQGISMADPKARLLVEGTNEVARAARSVVRLAKDSLRDDGYSSGNKLQVDGVIAVQEGVFLVDEGFKDSKVEFAFPELPRVPRQARMSDYSEVDFASGSGGVRLAVMRLSQMAGADDLLAGRTDDESLKKVTLQTFMRVPPTDLFLIEGGKSTFLGRYDGRVQTAGGSLARGAFAFRGDDGAFAGVFRFPQGEGRAEE